MAMCKRCYKEAVNNGYCAKCFKEHYDFKFKLPCKVGDVCHICGFPVHPGMKGKFKPSTDHIISVASGGMANAGNLHICHHQCNAIKARDKLTREIQDYAQNEMRCRFILEHNPVWKGKIPSYIRD